TVAIANALNAPGFARIGGLTPFAGQVTVTADVTDTHFTITYGGSLQAQPLATPIALAITPAPCTGSAPTQRVRAGSGVPTDVYMITYPSIGTQPPITVTGSSPAMTVGFSTVADGGIGAIVSTGATLQIDGDPNHDGLPASTISTPAVERLVLN